MRTTEFSDSGFFWLPEGPTRARQVPGSLTVSANGVVILETFGYMSTDPLSLASESLHRAGAEIGRVFGYTQQRGAVTLIGCLRADSGLQAPVSGAIFASARIFANVLLVGGHFGEHGPRFDRLTCRIEGLDEWLGMSGISAQHDIDAGQATIAFKAPAPVPLRIDHDVQGKIGFGYSIPGSSPWSTEAQVTQRAYFTLSTSDSWDIESLIDWAARLRDFLCLATDDPVAITSLDGYLSADDNTIAANSDERSRVQIIFESRQHSAERPNVKHWLAAFSHQDLPGGLSTALANWIAAYRKRPQPFGLFFDARYGDGQLPGDLQFLKVVEALDTFAPAFEIGESASLPSRIRRLCEPFADLLGLNSDCPDFAKRVQATRNFNVHHTERHKQFVVRGADLYRLRWQCEALMICHLTALVVGSVSDAIEVLREAEPITRRQSSA